MKRLKRDRSDIGLYLRRMIVSASIKHANAPEGGSWELVSVVEAPTTTTILMESRHPLHSFGFNSGEYAVGSVEIVIREVRTELET